jgi:hypothetical protein
MAVQTNYFFKTTENWLDSSKKIIESNHFVIDPIEYLGSNKLTFGLFKNNFMLVGSFELLKDGTVDITIFDDPNGPAIYYSTIYCTERDMLLNALNDFLNRMINFNVKR